MAICRHRAKAVVRQNCQKLPIFRAKTLSIDKNLISLNVLLYSSSLKFIEIANLHSGIFRTSLVGPSILGHLRLRKQYNLNTELP